MAARLGRWRASYAGMACPRCRRSLRHETLRSGEQACPSCNGSFEAIRFDPVEAKVVVPDLAGTGPEGAAADSLCMTPLPLRFLSRLSLGVRCAELSP